MNIQKSYIQLIFLGLGISILIFIFFQLIGFNGLYGQDSHEYLRYTKHFNQSILNFQKPNNYFWPVMYPLWGSILKLLFIPEIFALQFISIFSYVFTTIYINKIIEELYGKSNWIYTLIFFSLSPLVFRFGSVIMSDMLSLYFLTIGFYQLIRYDREKIFANLLLSVLFFALSFHCRYVSVMIFIVPFLYIFLKNIKSHSLYKYALLLLISVLISLPHISIKTASLSTFEHSWLLNWNFSSFFMREFMTVEGLKSYSLPNLLFVFGQNVHPRYFFGGILILFFFKRQDLRTILLLAIVPYLIFLSGIPFQNTRFILLSFPLFLVLLFPSFERLLERLKKNKSILLISIVSIQLGLCGYSFNKVYSLNKEEKINVNLINKLSDRKTIYTSGYEGPLRSYSDKKVLGIWTDSISDYNKSLFMINEVEMKDMSYPPTIKYNYKNIKENHKVKELGKFNKGWILYEIQ